MKNWDETGARQSQKSVRWSVVNGSYIQMFLWSSCDGNEEGREVRRLLDSWDAVHPCCSTFFHRIQRKSISLTLVNCRRFSIGNSLYRLWSHYSAFFWQLILLFSISRNAVDDWCYIFFFFFCFWRIARLSNLKDRKVVLFMRSCIFQFTGIIMHNERIKSVRPSVRMFVFFNHRTSLFQI